MSSGENLVSAESGCADREDVPLTTELVLSCGDGIIVKQDEGEGDGDDDDGDMGFNPCLEEFPSSDGSSSLSSEVDEVEAGIGGIEVNSFCNTEINSSELTDDVRSGAVDESDLCEEGKLLQGASCAEVCEVELPEHYSERLPAGDLEATSCIHRAVQQEEGQRSDDGKTSIASDDQDAIFKRTRARYSLAGFTLEELESFLQETDDDDDLRNVGDEEEYRKFLAAVLGGGDGDGQLALPTEVVDDDDEDNDADFEIELEEALGSDVDETPADKNQRGCPDRFSWRPETRQNRRQKVNVEHKRKLLEMGRRPLRPLLPLLPVGYDIPSTSYPLLVDTPNCACFTAGSGFMNGFTPHQIGQLYCLIHEHVQLLIQIYSLCVLDSTRQQIASVVQELLFEVLHKHEEAIARRSAPYPSFCFSPQYVFPTVPDQLCRLSQQHTFGSRPSSDAQIVDLSPDNQVPTVLRDSQINEQRKSGGNDGVGSHCDDGAVWLPYVSGPVLSIFDVAPLRMVKNYIQNVTLAVRENHRRHVLSSFDIRSEREPLFPLSSCPSNAEGDKQVSNVSGLSEVRNGPSSPSQQQFKRSLATTLVESSKKQSVALVPKEIAKLAQVFYPLFNKALFPHKPPLASVTNRVLFTDAEDELLALGMMEYNTDWKAIQQRFLPCKSKHQIFVRQKNRCSSKAPENPIKTVRRMKTSPLTAEEMQYIQEGLKIYKLDWMSVWKYVVPHRDPSLLPRQWRIAMGIQKSYKVDLAKKQKRCKYEAERRRRAAILGAWQVASEKEDHNARGENSSGDDCVDDPDEAYVHEAFLADWTPGSFSQVTNNAREQSLCHIYGEGLSQSVNQAGLPIASSCMRTPAAPLRQGSCASSSFVDPVSCRNGRTSIPPPSRQSRRGCRVESARLVKLAPNLPPVNLPQNVRVISASAYHHNGAFLSLSLTEARADHNGFRSASHRSLQVEGLEMMHVRNTKNDTSMAVAKDGAYLESEDSAVNHENRSKGESDGNTSIPMHPLLFQAPENAPLPYYLRNSSGLASTSLNFFSSNPPQLNLSLFHNSPQQNQVAAHFHTSPKPSYTSCVDGIDFHPLLGRTESTSTEMLHKHPRTEPSARLNVSRARKPAAGGLLTALTNHSDQVDKSNELDLNIHRNSTPGKTVERSDEATCKKMWCVGDRTPVDPRERKNPSGKDPENSSLISCKTPGSVGTHIDSVHSCDVDIVGEQSHPEIVMEQEELSDSEEDIEENVEFECEEMADSDREDEADTDLTANSLDKAIQHHRSENPLNLANDDHEHELTAGPVDRQDKGNLYIAKLGLTGERNDIASKSWLSLDPHAGGRLSNPESKEGANTICKENVDEGCVAPLSSRSRKRMRPNPKCDVAELHNQSIGCVKQVELDQFLSIGPLKRPRKNSCGKNASSISVKEVENGNFLAKDSEFEPLPTER